MTETQNMQWCWSVHSYHDKNQNMQWCWSVHRYHDQEPGLYIGIMTKNLHIGIIPKKNRYHDKKPRYHNKKIVYHDKKTRYHDEKNMYRVFCHDTYVQVV